MTTIAVLVLAGMWLERFVLVAPSLWHENGIPLGLIEVLITAGVFSLFAWCYGTFLRAFTVLPVSDPRLAPTA